MNIREQQVIMNKLRSTIARKCDVPERYLFGPAEGVEKIRYKAIPTEDDDFSWLEYDPRFIEEFNDLCDVE